MWKDFTVPLDAFLRNLYPREQPHYPVCPPDNNKKTCYFLLSLQRSHFIPERRRRSEVNFLVKDHLKLYVSQFFYPDCLLLTN